MHRVSRRHVALALTLLLTLALASDTALAQYNVTALVRDSGKAKHLDPQLINAWGLAYGPAAPFWLSDTGTGLSTLYDGKGVKQSLVVTIPPAGGGAGMGSPTGIVYNASNEFRIRSWVSAFIFATLDGTISGWSHFVPNAALLAVDNSGSGASYTGLAITNKPSGNFIYAADFGNNKVDVYDGNFAFVKSFSDPTIPAGFNVFGIQDISGQVYVAYADINNGPGGYIDVFNEDGTFVKTLIQGDPLNQPWGFAVAPSNFGSLSNTLLISNNTATGTINGFDLTTGAFVGTITTPKGKPIMIDQLWGIEFGGGTKANGKTNQLFFTAGPNDYVNGEFGVIKAKIMK